MSQPTPTPSTGHPADDWRDLSAVVDFPTGDDTIHASIHPGTLDVTVGYRGDDGMVITARHLGAWIELLQRVQTELSQDGAR